jgi:hypothetical protein
MTDLDLIETAYYVERQKSEDEVMLESELDFEYLSIPLWLFSSASSESDIQVQVLAQIGVSFDRSLSVPGCTLRLGPS